MTLFNTIMAPGRTNSMSIPASLQCRGLCCVIFVLFMLTTLPAGALSSDDMSEDGPFDGYGDADNDGVSGGPAAQEMDKDVFNECMAKCPRIQNLRCGIDGKTYSNLCMLKCNNTSEQYAGPCRSKPTQSPNENTRGTPPPPSPPQGGSGNDGAVIHVDGNGNLHVNSSASGRVLITGQDILQQLQDLEGMAVAINASMRGGG